MNIRPSPIVGRWYPGEQQTLTQMIGRYLDRAQVTLPDRLWGIVAPHAGYAYSGQVAAYAFSCLRGLQPELVAVVSPLHSSHHAAVLTSAYDAYETPLGLVEVDGAAVHELDQALQPRLGQGMARLRYDREHAVEIELPFLQHVLRRFRLLPVMLLDQRTAVARAVGEALAQVLQGRNALLVASSDLSHFYPQPMAQRLDTEILRRLQAFDPQAVIKAEQEGVGYACGHGAIAAVLWATEALGANRVSLLHQATSGDVTGDYDSVVGYAAAAIWQTNNE